MHFLSPTGLSTYRTIYQKACRTDVSLHDDYHDNTGLVPYHSNAALLQDIPDDRSRCFFGSRCRSVARPGLKRGLGQDEDWLEFDRVVQHMGRSSVKACLYECSADLIRDAVCGPVLQHVLNTFDAAGFVVQFDVACPSNFGWGVARARALFVCLRRSVAEVVGPDFARVVSSGPIGRHTGRTKCVADYMERPRGDSPGTGIVNFEEWREERRAKHDEDWEIQWFAPYDTKLKRDAIRRDEAVARRQPLTLGYANLAGDSTKETRTGHKVGSVYGTLHGITHTDMASGPGGNCAMYYDPLTGQVETPSDETLAKLWGVRGLRGMTLKNLGQSAHPATLTANFQLITLLLDKYYYLSQSVPRVPLVKFESVLDVYTTEGLAQIDAWVAQAGQWRAEVLRDPERNRKVPAPLVLGQESVQFWARGRYFDLRPCSEGRPPKRLEREGKADHDIHLLGLPHL